MSVVKLDGFTRYVLEIEKDGIRDARKQLLSLQIMILDESICQQSVSMNIITTDNIVNQKLLADGFPPWLLSIQRGNVPMVFTDDIVD